MREDGQDERNDAEEPARRLFNLEEAEQLLPQLRVWLSEAVENRRRVVTIEDEFSQVQNRILLYGGLIPPHAYLSDKRLERDGYVRLLRESLERITETGCLVKDLDSGLIDFPARIGNEEALLCWKLGEEHIGYWHREHEGFAGRKPLDAGEDSGSKPN